MKRLLFITGTRADYGKLEPLAMAAQVAGFKISFFITGMHMMCRYGETRVEVRRFPEAEFFEFVNQREGDPLDFVLAKTVMGFSDFVHEHKPDLVIVHGDRVEALATSIVCAMKYIPSAHIEGGEVSGTIDESLRHCNTKLCTTHFVCSEAAYHRVINLGEAEDRVFCIGSPELDTHAKPSGVSIEEVAQRYEVPTQNYGVVIFHPVTSEVKMIGKQAEALFDRLVTCGRNFVVIMPNNDPGTEKIIEVLDKLPKDRFRIIASMRFNYFSELLRNASAMIGNSSVGVREAPFLGVPSLDIGTRQNERATSPSIVSASAYDSSIIDDFLSTRWGERCERSLEFGVGQAAAKFVEVLMRPDYWSFSQQKKFNG
ncbi:MAG: UDP-N-acetylglucosamine 2-epimerase (hydrolyzing) [Akkermansiaceae bacterium]|nr:UDP-N-acetylglucosamine 2-epimerase (hydrolyzing) [Akkermansiaceae bacterium]